MVMQPMNKYSVAIIIIKCGNDNKNENNNGENISNVAKIMSIWRM